MFDQRFVGGDCGEFGQDVGDGGVAQGGLKPMGHRRPHQLPDRGQQCGQNGGCGGQRNWELQRPDETLSHVPKMCVTF